MNKPRRGIARRADLPPRAAGPGRPSAAGPSPRRVTPVVAGVAIAGLVVVLAAIAVAVATGAGPAPSGVTASPVLSPTEPVRPTATGPEATLGIPCEASEQIAYHVHAHLNIRFGGVLQPVPANIGIQPTCFSWLHTHAAFGVIHVEAAEERPFSLGSFFDVWGQALGPGQVLDHVVAPGESVRVFVDGVPFEGDPRSVPLRDLEAIEVQVGPEALDPLPYTFPAEFR